MDIWAQLTMGPSEMEKLSRLLNGGLLNKSGNSKTYTPLQFWFCRNYGLALPLIALQYHEVKLNIQFKDKFVYADPTNNQEYIYSSASSTDMKNLRVFCDYIFSWSRMERFVQFTELMERGLISEKDISKYDSWDMLEIELFEAKNREMFKRSKKERG